MPHWKGSTTLAALRSIVIALGICLGCSFFSPAWSSGQTIETVGEYLVGDGETMSVGLERARQIAIRQAAEQAGSLVRSYSKVHNMTLQEDVIEVVANHAMKITTFPEKREMAGNAIRITVPIRAEIMEGEIERSIERAMQQHEEVTAFQQLKQEILRQARELENLKQQLAKATELNKAQLLSRIGANENSFKARALVEEGSRLAAQLQFADADAKFTKAIELDPRLALAYAGRAEAALFSGDSPRIQKDIAAAIDLDPKNPSYYALRGRAVATRHCHGAVQDRCQEVMDDLKRAITLAPGLPQYHQALGIIYATMDKPEQAEAEYALSLHGLDTGDPMVELNAYLGRSKFYLGNGAPGYLQKATLDLDKAVTIIKGPAFLPADHDKYWRLMKCEAKSEQEALQCIATIFGAKFASIEDFKKSEFSPKLEQVLKSRSDLSLLLWQRSQVRYESGDVDGANADREECCNILGPGASIVDRNGFILSADFCAPAGSYRPFGSPGKLAAYQHLQLGIRVESGLHHQRAEREFTAAIKNDPACFDAYLQRGFMYMSNDALAKARADYDQAIVVDPASGRAYNERGMVRSRAGDYSGAVEDFTRAFQLNPQDNDVLRKRAHIYEAMDETDKAVADYLDYARKNASDPEFMLNAVSELDRMGRYPEERQLLEEYLEIVRHWLQENPDDQRHVERVREGEERLKDLEVRLKELETEK
jgi:tetratricopeptide (TPR) repeat protein